MAQRDTIIKKLKGAATRGEAGKPLIEIINEEMGSEISSFAVMSLLVEAFGVSLADIRELPGARCLGGQIYDDEQAETLIKLAIQKAEDLRQ